VNRVAAKITQKVDVFLEYYDLDPERAGRKPSIIPAGPPPTMQQPVWSFVWISPLIVSAKTKR